MKYYHSKQISDVGFEQAIEKVTDALKAEGFGVLTQIDIKETLKKKLDEDFRPYTILGACNPPYAFKALSTEDKIGTMLPCNVIVQQMDNGIEVAAINPEASMQAVDNKNLQSIATEIKDRLVRVVDSL